jgi:dienelactone hydrolase
MRLFVKTRILAFSFVLFGSAIAAAQEPPRTVEALFADFDPRKEALDTEVVREWEKDGVVYRYVTYHVGTFKGKPARMAAFFGFPQGGRNLPGLLHLHGGGQRAFQHEVEYYAKRGYACLSINWGGREMEDAKPGDPNTDWGAVDPTQQNVPGYFNLKPGDKYLDPFESPRNNNWYLLTLGARRGLTFLEEQQEVDPDRLGVYGHSMGGNLTVYVAGTDSRVKVAAPSVGGQGFRTCPWPLLPQQRKITPNGDIDLFRATLGFQSYAPHIRSPLLWLGATNDFHGIMDDTYRTGALIPNESVRYAFTPHMNHRFTPEFAVTRPLWIDQHLKGTFRLPEMPKSELDLSTDDGAPFFSVTSDQSKPVDQVHIYYSIDPDPQARFWRSADANKSGATWIATLPIMSVRQPLFAFANVHYRLDKAEPVQFAKPTRTFAISSALHTATPEKLQKADVKATDQPTLLIDDFSKGWQDWYRLSADNPHHWQFWTRKITDPKWRGKSGYEMAFDVQSEKPNELVVVLTENFFRSYRGKRRDFVAVVTLKASDGFQPVQLKPSDFKAADGDGSLSSWENLDLLGLRAYYGSRREKVTVGSTEWSGQKPRFQNLRWVPTSE